MLKYFRLVVLSVTVWFIPAALTLAAVPNVLVTIKPTHSLVSGLMNGITEPRLLIEGYQSPHTFQLRPDDMNKIQQADMIIWIGPGIETALRRIINDLDNKRVIQLSEEGHAEEGHTEEGHAHSHLHEDPHRWLDPVLALEDARRIGQTLIHHFPDHADTIQQNLDQLTGRLQQLDRDIRLRFPSPETVPALLYHDAWGYFTRRYQLKTHGLINPNPHTQPGTRHLQEIDTIIKEQQTRCLLIEPQFQPRYIKSLQEKYQLKEVVLDPLGADLPTGPDTYFTMMRRIADAFAQCL